ncbi:MULTISPECIES: hypothetical protein [unclassified Caballeronia]|uniref:hypothetical protein n=1 Tax=unclassified Caballeronia TaxID=2646786 RepID=UPI002862F746|nr:MULTISPECIES: hypothetical protein [unclassified Caballeronia]MDR5880837.1 hypothetical protein [Caballeronia sp. LZ032]
MDTGLVGDVTSPGGDDAGVAVDAGLDGEAGLVDVSLLVTGTGVVTTGLVAAAAFVGATAAPLVDVLAPDVPPVADAFAVEAWADVDVPLAAALAVGLAADAVPALSPPPPPPPPHAASITLIASVAADIATPRTREKRKPEERRDSKFVM